MQVRFRRMVWKAFSALCSGVFVLRLTASRVFRNARMRWLTLASLGQALPNCSDLFVNSAMTTLLTRFSKGAVG
jgi:hypothetical protein